METVRSIFDPFATALDYVETFFLVLFKTPCVHLDGTSSAGKDALNNKKVARPTYHLQTLSWGGWNLKIAGSGGKVLTSQIYVLIFPTKYFLSIDL